jgi:uncharacterized protein (DUF1330 family)
VPTYVIFGVRNITDQAKMARYNKLGAEATAKHDRKFLAGPVPDIHLEGAEPFEKVVLLEFADRASAENWYYSDEYQAAKKIREGIADTFAVLIDGAPARK